MKRMIFSLALIVFSLNLLAQDISRPEHINRWSLGIRGGVDYYRVTPNGKNFASNGSWAAGLSLEYGITPYFGIGLDGGYFAYNRGKEGQDYKGSTIDATIYGSLNLSNLVSPRRTGFWRHVNLYLNGGLGAGFFRYDLNHGQSKDNDVSALGFVGMNLAFSLGRVVELGLEGQYRNYTREDMGGISNPKSIFSDAIVATVGLRFKFGAGGKKHPERVHVRNMLPGEYYPMPMPEPIVIETPHVLDHQLMERVDELEKENKALNDKLQRLENEMKALEKEMSGVVTASFDNVEFAFNSAQLTSSSKNILDHIVRILKENPSWNRLTVSGHTDNVGTREVNKRLSEQRAETVKDFLVSHGIPASKITTVGYGYDKPLESNNTAHGRQSNRRVEFEIIK